MDPLKLGNQLVDRLRDAHSRGLDLTIVEDFVGVNSEAVHRWLDEHKAPRGENLGRLWYLLAALDLPSPELEYLSSYQRYLGELLAYRVVSFGYSNMNDAQLEQTSNDTVREIVNEKRHREAYSILRGEREPAEPTIKTTKDLREMYGTALEEAKAAWKERFAAVTESLHTSADNRQSDPPAQSEVARQVRAAVARTRNSTNPVITSTPLTQPAATAPSSNYLLMLELAQKLSSVVPLLQHALSEACTDEDRATMRGLLGQDQLFTLNRLLNRLTSTRAFNEGA